MRVLVTGGCGYIGSVLVPLLIDDERVAEVVVLDSLVSGSPRAFLGAVGPDLEFHRGDVRKYGDVERALCGVDRVIHLAAITGAERTHDRREETFTVTLEGTANVVTAAGDQGVDSVVFASSCTTYGRTATTNVDETTALDPLNPDAESKVAAEQLVRDAGVGYGFDTTSLRTSTNYGLSSGIRFDLVVNHFVFRGVTNRPLTVYGDGENWRPFVHVEDAARAYADAALRPDAWSKPVYNVGATDENYRIAEIAEIVRDELGRPLEITSLEDEHPEPSSHVNFDRLAETGFEPRWTLREGVRDLLAHFEDAPTARRPRDTVTSIDVPL